MNQKQLGVILIIIGIVLAGVVYSLKSQSDAAADLLMATSGSCFLEDGTCLHKTGPTIIIGWILSGLLVAFGVYIGFIDKTQQFLTEHQVKVSTALESAKRAEKEKDEFNAYLAGFSEEERLILKAVKEQDGIKQSTLKYRTGLSKTQLSLLLKRLEDRDVLKRKASGKTKQVFLRKKF